MKRLVFLVLIGVLLNCEIAFASTSYRDWEQFEGEWSTLQMSPGSDLIKSSGCTTVSLAILLKHSGLMDESFTPSTLIDYFVNNDYYDANSCLTSFSLDSYTNGNFKCRGDVWNVSPSDISKKYKEGYFLLICMYDENDSSNQHWIACLDASSEDNIIVADPGNSSTTLKESQKIANKYNLRYFWYESTGKKSTELSATQDTSSTSAITTNDDKSNLVNLGNGKYGLVDPMTGKVYQLVETAIEFQSREDLSKEQLKGVVDWKNNIEYENEDYFIKYLRIFVMLLGIIFLVWMLLIYLSYWFDRINNFLDIDLLPIVTLGRLRVSPEEGECTFASKVSKGEVKTVNHRTIVMICLTGILFSVFIITGKLYEVLSYLVRKILSILG